MRLLSALMPTKTSRASSAVAGASADRVIVELVRVIGYYVHHHGFGHRNRAVSVSQAYDGDLVGLSTLPRPVGWTGDWIVLPDDAGAGPRREATANGRLHYAPLHWPGLAGRMAKISSWLATTRPTAVVVDVSVEVGTLVRLHGVPVLSMAQPGVRTDPAHLLGYDLATAIIAPWPSAVEGLWAATDNHLSKTKFVGPICRSPVASHSPVLGRRVVVLNGAGGSGATAADVEAARLATPGWEWIHLDRVHGTWVGDPSRLLSSATAVISHAGQNAIAEIAAVRRPALLIPQDRPFDEQQTMAAALCAANLPVQVAQSWPAQSVWPSLLARLARLDGTAWNRWNDGEGAVRAAAVLDEFTQTPVATPVPA